MAEDIIGRILDLDSRAEAVRARAREEADRVRRETAKSLEEARAAHERQGAERLAAINARAARERDAQLTKLRQHLAEEAEAVRRIPPEKIEAAVLSVLDKLRRPRQ